MRRRVKWTLALVPDFWTAQQGVVWAATAEDTEGLPSGVRRVPRSWRGQMTVAWMTRARDTRWEVLLASDLILQWAKCSLKM